MRGDLIEIDKLTGQKGYAVSGNADDPGLSNVTEYLLAGTKNTATTNSSKARILKKLGYSLNRLTRGNNIKLREDPGEEDRDIVMWFVRDNLMYETYKTPDRGVKSDHIIVAVWAHGD